MSAYAVAKRNEKRLILGFVKLLPFNRSDGQCLVLPT